MPSAIPSSNAATSSFARKRRVHLEIRVEVLNRVIGQRDVMRADFAANLDPARLRFAQNPDAASGADMLAMNVMIAEFRQEDVAHDDRLLARARPARQAEKRAPIAFVHHPVTDEIVILAVIENREAHHAGVFDGAAHQLVILDATAIIGDRDDTGLRERADRRQFFAQSSLSKSRLWGARSRTPLRPRDP